MIKFVQLIRRRPDLTRQQFIDHYENHHAPLILRLIPGIHAFRRNYLVLDDPLAGNGGDDFASDNAFESSADFDVMTEVIFASRDDLERSIEAYLKPEIHAVIAADELRFVAPKGVRRFVVDVHES